MIKRIDINAMKQADSICFRTVKKNEKMVTTIECSKKKSETTPFESNHVFMGECKNKAVQCIGSFLSPKEPMHCFEMFSLYDFDFCPLKTAISLLKVDDTIRLVWYKGAGSTEDLKENGFVSDHLYLEIIRKDKVKYNFLLSVSTGRDNSARMIKDNQ